jgi:hypothetical protein
VRKGEEEKGRRGEGEKRRQGEEGKRGKIPGNPRYPRSII